MPTTLIQHTGGHHAVPLAFRRRSDRDAACLLALNASLVVAVALQAVVIGLAWPEGEPEPWLAGPKAEVDGLERRVRGAEAWLSECSKKGNEEDVQQARKDLRLRREDLAAGKARLAAAAVTLSSDVEHLRATADRIVDALGIPPAAVYLTGKRLLDEAAEDFFRGYAEYSTMAAGGFSQAPDGPSSAGASSSPESTAATPSSG